MRKIMDFIRTKVGVDDWCEAAGLPALYGLVSDHDGTQEDPIPYEPWMLLDEGLYYTDGGRLYGCTTSSNVGYDAGIDSLAALVKPVEGAAS